MDQTKSPKRWWKPPSFDDFNVESPNKKMKLDSVKPVVQEEKEEVIRIVVPEPETVEDLVTHPKKIEEVKNALNLSNPDKPHMILVTGPAGSAKTTTIKVVASSLNYSVKEWINPVDKISFKEDKLFNGDPYDKYNYSEKSQVEKFEDYIFQTSRYKSIFEETSKSIILLEDFPNIFVWQPKKFHEFLGKYKIKGKSLIIFICTDDENMNLQKELFPNNILEKYAIKNIKFNPVSHTALMKVLKKIMEKYSDTTAVSNETLENISQVSSGDLRSAISELQILLIGLKPTRIVKPVKNSKKKNGSLPNFKPVTLKDTNMDFYKVIGRVLYPKKAAEKEKANFENKNRILLYDVKDLTEYYSNSFLSLLQENYIHTFGRFNDTMDAADLLSTCDLFDGNDDLKDYAGVLSIAGLMIKNKESNKGKFRPVSKSRWTALSKRNNLDKLTHYKDFQVTYRNLELDVIPYLKFLPRFRNWMEYEDLNRLRTKELSQIVIPDVDKRIRENPVADDEGDNMEIEEVE